MLPRLATIALTLLLASGAAVGDAVEVHVKLHHSHHHHRREAEASTAPSPSPSPTPSSSPSSSSPTPAPAGFNTTTADGGWRMATVTSIQARVQGNTPAWDATTKTWVASFGKTYDEQRRSVLDTVNTASVEGALMYVQAEGINVKEQSVKCERKNKMQYVVFYEITFAQPEAAVAFYGGGKHSTPEYCPFVAMDSGKCTEAGSDIPDTCKQFDGLDGQPELGHCVGANEQKSDPRAPYPGNYWFSFPNSCVTKGWKDKTEACRAEHPGGLCPVGVVPDGIVCTFSYKILGYLNIDDLVGITDGSGTKDGVAHKNFTEFCQAGGVEFSAENTGSGFKVDEALAFWEKPGDETANAARTKTMIDKYNKFAPTSVVGAMVPLPDLAALSAKNPPCYLNDPKCAGASHGCRRTLYSQICEVCDADGPGCVKAPAGFKFPTLVVPDVAEDADAGSARGSSSVAGGSGGSTTGSAGTTNAPASADSPSSTKTPTPSPKKSSAAVLQISLAALAMSTAGWLVVA